MGRTDIANRVLHLPIVVTSQVVAFRETHGFALASGSRALSDPRWERSGPLPF
jgi:hypothetical protein